MIYFNQNKMYQLLIRVTVLILCFNSMHKSNAQKEMNSSEQNLSIQATKEANFYPNGKEIGDVEIADLHFNLDIPPIKFYDRIFSNIYIPKSYGYLLFGAPGDNINKLLNKYPNPQYPEKSDPPLIAVFSAAAKTQKIFYRIINTSEGMKEVTSTIKAAFPSSTGTWQPTNSLFITWNSFNTNEGTNIFQAVLVWDNNESYVILNYDQIIWTKYTAANQDYVAQVGFNAGNAQGWFPVLPDVNQLTEADTVGIKGRHVFRINGKRLERGGCLPENVLQKSHQFDLNVDASMSTMMGGDSVRVSGPCVTDSQLPYHCQFTRGEYEVSAQAQVNNDTGRPHLSCIVPTMWQVGTFQLDLKYENQKALFRTEFMIVPPEETHSSVVFIDDLSKIYDSLSFDFLTISWNVSNFKWQLPTVNLSIVGYSESVADNNQIRPSLVTLQTIGIDNSGSYRLNEDLLKCEMAECETHHVGFIVIESANSTSQTKKLWSQLLPLGWFVKDYMTREKGGAWPNDKCDTLTSAQTHIDLTCPCTLKQAESAIGELMETNYCPRLPNHQCSSASVSQRCFIHILPYTNSNEQKNSICCYMTASGSLIFGSTVDYSTELSHGSYTSSTNPNLPVPFFSNWIREQMPFFYCCKWSSDKSSDCQRIWKTRSLSQCTTFVPGKLAAIMGDPHFVPFSTNFQYTFNGKGEFTVLESKDGSSFKLQIRATNPETAEGATLIRGLAFRVKDKPNYGIYVLSGDSEPWRITQNKNSIDISDTDPDVLMKKVTFASGEHGLHLIISISNSDTIGILIKRQTVNNVLSYLNLFVAVSSSLKGKTRGLLGEWVNGEGSSGLFLKNSETTFEDIDNLTNVYHEFGKGYKIKEEDSLFLYELANSFNSINNDQSYKPLKSLTPTDDDKSFCQENKFCLYDRASLPADLKTQISNETLRDSLQMATFNNGLIPVGFCGSPNINGAKYDSLDFALHQTVVVSKCLYSDRKIETITLKCIRNSVGEFEWSPGYEKNICTAPIKGAQTWLIVVIVLVVLVIIVLAIGIGFFVFRTMKRRSSENEESGTSASEPAELHPPNQIKSAPQMTSNYPDDDPVVYRTAQHGNESNSGIHNDSFYVSTDEVTV